MVDVEATGPIPGDFVMTEIGAVVVKPELLQRFHAKLLPYARDEVAGYSQEDVFVVDEPLEVMRRFEEWLTNVSEGRPMFISDNNGFDWQFINYYFHHFLGVNPFGHSSTNLGSLYKGLVKDVWKSFKFLRETPHTHNALDDAIGNAEAFIKMKELYDLKVGWGK